MAQRSVFYSLLKFSEFNCVQEYVNIPSVRFAWNGLNAGKETKQTPHSWSLAAAVAAVGLKGNYTIDGGTSDETIPENIQSSSSQTVSALLHVTLQK